MMNDKRRGIERWMKEKGGFDEKEKWTGRLKYYALKQSQTL
jgi:hypothetical protein